MTAREAILQAIRAVPVPDAPNPPPPHETGSDGRNLQALANSRSPGSPADLLKQFTTMVAVVGGSTQVLVHHESLERAIAQLGGSLGAGMIAIPGRFGVAENGAVYVDADDVPARVDVVRAEHLVLTLHARDIVADMHDAVQRMPPLSRCGWFLSGPSKTADIEQALVIGAQGARSLLVLVVPD